MTNENRAQPACIIEIGFERKNAEHEIKPARHLFNATAVPGPDLRTDVVDNFLQRGFLRQRPREPQIEARVIDQHDRVRLTLSNLAQRLAKLFSKVTVVLDHFPKSEHA